MAINIKFDLKKLPRGVALALSLTPAVIIAVVVVLFVVMPKTKEIKKLNADVAAQQNEIAKSKAMAEKLDVLKVENDKLKKRLDELKEQLPEEKEVSSLLKQISEVAAKSEVDILSWKPEVKRAHPSGIVEEIPFSLNLAGTYHTLGNFFSSLTRLNRIVNLSNISLTYSKMQRDEALLSITFRASTFSAVKETGK